MRWRIWVLIAVVLAALVAGCSDDDDPRHALDEGRWELVDAADAWQWAPRGRLQMDWEAPSGVERLGGGGSTDPNDAARESSTSDDTDLDELDLESAARVVGDEDGGVWLLTYGAIAHSDGERVDRFYDVAGGSVSAFAVGSDGQLAISNFTGISVFERREDDFRVVSDRSSGFRTNGLAYQPDGTLLAGGPLDDRLVAVDDGQERPLLVASGESPGGTSGDGLGSVGFVTVLTDGRVVLASWVTDTELTLWVFADGEARPLGEAGEQFPPQVITSIAPAPDGGLLVTTGESIEVVDVDSGESETLVDLEGAEGTFSATATGSDVIFLADGRLWRLRDAFD